MKIAQIYEYLDSISPFELQEKWDNSGLLLGSFDREIERVVVSLDIDEEMIEKYESDTLFILHHPIIFGKLSQLDFSKYPSNLIEKAILKRQSIIAMHTNFDKTHLNRFVFREILGLEISREDDFICEAEVNWTIEELKERVSKAFDLKYLKIVAPKEQIKSIALTTGAGASLMDMVKADCFLTGDIKYHDAMKAISQNLMMIDIGHFESEQFFSQALIKELKKLPISAIITHSRNPFNISIMDNSTNLPSSKDKD